jgi:putative membrane protein
VVGLLRVFYFEKGSEYYFTNGFFLIKFGMFLLTGLLSIIPTLGILSWRKATRTGEAPTVDAARLKRMRMAVHIELAAIVVIILCAALMARSFEL